MRSRKNRDFLPQKNLSKMPARIDQAIEAFRHLWTDEDGEPMPENRAYRKVLDAGLATFDPGTGESKRRALNGDSIETLLKDYMQAAYERYAQAHAESEKVRRENNIESPEGAPIYHQQYYEETLAREAYIKSYEIFQFANRYSAGHLQGPPPAMALPDFSLDGEDDEVLIPTMNAEPRMLWYGGPGCRNKHVNALVELYTGVSAADIRERGWISLLHPEDRMRIVQIYATASATRDLRPFRSLYRIRRSDGHWGVIMDRTRPHLDRRREFAGYIGTMYHVDTDIVERALALPSPE